MSEPSEILNRTNELLDQLLEQERQKTSFRQEQMDRIREKINIEIPKLEELSEGTVTKGLRNPETEARLREMKEEAEQRLQKEIAFRDRLVAILDEQTAILTEIAVLLRR